MFDKQDEPKTEQSSPSSQSSPGCAFGVQEPKTQAEDSHWSLLEQDASTGERQTPLRQVDPGTMQSPLSWQTPPAVDCALHTREKHEKEGWQSSFLPHAEPLGERQVLVMQDDPEMVQSPPSSHVSPGPA